LVQKKKARQPSKGQFQAIQSGQTLRGVFAIRGHCYFV
jgi:hypothetical protein